MHVWPHLGLLCICHVQLWCFPKGQDIQRLFWSDTNVISGAYLYSTVRRLRSQSMTTDMIGNQRKYVWLHWPGPGPRNGQYIRSHQIILHARTPFFSILKRPNIKLQIRPIETFPSLRLSSTHLAIGNRCWLVICFNTHVQLYLASPFLSVDPSVILCLKHTHSHLLCDILNCYLFHLATYSAINKLLFSCNDDHLEYIDVWHSLIMEKLVYKDHNIVVSLV